MLSVVCCFYLKPIQFPFFPKETTSTTFTAQSKISVLNHWSSQGGHVSMHVTTGYSCTVVLTPSEPHSPPNIPHVQESIFFLVHKYLAELWFPGYSGYVVSNFHHQSDYLLSDHKKSQKEFEKFIFNSALGRNGRMGGEERRRGLWHFHRWVGKEFWFQHNTNNTMISSNTHSLM